MSRAKASLPWGSTTLLEHLLHKLQPRFEPLVVVCEGQMSLPDLSPQIQLVIDPISHLGPLAGFSNGLGHVPDDRPVFLTGCDFPFLQSTIVDFLLDRLGDADAVVTQWQGIIQPLVGLYHPRIAHTVDEQIASGKRSLMDLLEQIYCKTILESEWLRFDPSGQMLMNINTPEEYEQTHKYYLSSISSSE